MQQQSHALGLQGVEPGTDGMGNAARQDMILKVQALAAAQAQRN